MLTFDKSFRSTVHEGTCGKWRVERFHISKEDANTHKIMNINQLVKGFGDRSVEAGTFTRLMKNGEVIMSDTAAEVSDLNPLVYAARRNPGEGRVLIHGLGLGLAVEILMRIPAIKRVKVIELDPDVITLTGNILRKRYHDRLEILQGDALEWKPPKGEWYNLVWSDIWDAITTDNLPQMTKLKRKYCRRTMWHGFWAEREHMRAKYLGY